MLRIYVDLLIIYYVLVKYVVDGEPSCDFGVLSFPDRPELNIVVTDSNIG